VVVVVSLSKDRETSVVVVSTVKLCQEVENAVTVDDVVVDVVSVLTVVSVYVLVLVVREVAVVYE
jgi:hypothetical protein